MNRILPFLVLATAASLPAHDTWLQPAQPAVPPGGTARLELTSADGFKGLDYGPAADRVRSAAVRLAGRTTALRIGPEEVRSLGFSFTAEDNGVATVWVELSPKVLELEPHLIDVYFDEILAPQSLRRQWAAQPAPKRWRERYVKLAKTFVRVGPPDSGDRSWAEPAGLALEIVPESDPTGLRAGGEFPVRVLKNGQPLAGLPVVFVSDGEGSHRTATTDTEGRASARLDRAGRWLVRGTDLRWLGQPGLEWESDFATFVVTVSPAP